MFTWLNWWWPGDGRWKSWCKLCGSPEWKLNIILSHILSVHITEFGMLYHCASAEGGAETHFIGTADIHALHIVDEPHPYTLFTLDQYHGSCALGMDYIYCKQMLAMLYWASTVRPSLVCCTARHSSILTQWFARNTRQNQFLSGIATHRSP